MSSHAADLAHRLARNAEAVCRHYLSNGHREGRYWLVGDVANTPGRSLFVRLHGPDSGKGAAGKWTDAATGEHGDLLDLIALNRGLDRLRDALDEARIVPQPAASRPRADDPARDLSGASRVARICTPSLRHVAADFGHNRRSVSAPTRHYGFARKRRSALPSALLLSPRCRRTDRDLAGTDRRRHRSRRQDHRRAPHLARPVRPRQGADRHAAAGNGPSSRTWGPVRRGERRDGGRRRHRDHAVAAQHHAKPADGRGALRQSPRRHPVPGSTAPSLRRTRFRSGRRRGVFDAERPGGSGRDRGAGRFRQHSATSTRICSASALPNFGHACASNSRRRTWSVSWTGRRPRRDDVPGSARRRLHRIVMMPFVSERAAPTAFQRAIGRQAARPGNGGWPTIFRRREGPPLHREAK